MRSVNTRSIRFALVATAVAVLAAGSASAQDLVGETDWTRASLQRADSLAWTPGTGAFQGGEVAVLGYEAATGRTALMVRMPQRALGTTTHVHSPVAHTLLLDGSIVSTVNGQRIQMGPGDYYRATSSVSHVATKIESPTATMFMLIEGAFDTKPAAAGSSPKASAPNLLWSEPALFSFGALRWEDGSGDMAGAQLALVGTDTTTGRSAFFVKIPQRMLGEQPHFHTSTAHTIVIAGQITTSIAGQQITMGPGDYFRSTPDSVHVATKIDSASATLFMITDGRFDTLPAGATAK